LVLATDKVTQCLSRMDEVTMSI